MNYNAEIGNLMHSVSYDKFQKDRGYDYARGFSKEEIEWALYEINYKYFGMYEFTDQHKFVVV